MDPQAFQETTKRLHDLKAKADNLKEYLVAMDRRRQDNRVAARGIEKELRHSKVWMSAGDVFLRMSRADAKAVMKKDDETVADEIENARRELLEVNAAMEGLAGSGTAHRVATSLQGMNSSEVNELLGGLPGRVGTST